MIHRRVVRCPIHRTPKIHCDRQKLPQTIIKRYYNYIHYLHNERVLPREVRRSAQTLKHVHLQRYKPGDKGCENFSNGLKKKSCRYLYLYTYVHFSPRQSFYIIIDKRINYNNCFSCFLSGYNSCNPTEN